MYPVTTLRRQSSIKSRSILMNSTIPINPSLSHERRATPLISSSIHQRHLLEEIITPNGNGNLDDLKDLTADIVGVRCLFISTRRDKERLAKTLRPTVKKWYRQTDHGSPSVDSHWFSTLLRRKPTFKFSTIIDDDEDGSEAISFVFKFRVRVSILGFYKQFQEWIEAEHQARNGIPFQFAKGGVRLSFGHLKHGDKPNWVCFITR